MWGADPGNFALAGGVTLLAGVGLGVLLRWAGTLALAFQGVVVLCAAGAVFAGVFWPDPGSMITPIGPGCGVVAFYRCGGGRDSGGHRRVGEAVCRILDACHFSAAYDAAAPWQLVGRVDESGASIWTSVPGAASGSFLGDTGHAADGGTLDPGRTRNPESFSFGAVCVLVSGYRCRSCLGEGAGVEPGNRRRDVRSVAPAIHGCDDSGYCVVGAR